VAAVARTGGWAGSGGGGAGGWAGSGGGGTGRAGSVTAAAVSGSGVWDRLKGLGARARLLFGQDSPNLRRSKLGHRRLDLIYVCRPLGCRR
jgi:hypothetical protein